jgi:hypothetical protein
MRSTRVPSARAASAASLAAMRRGHLVRAAALCACAAAVSVASGCGASHTRSTAGSRILTTSYTTSDHAVRYLKVPTRLATQPLPGGAIHLLAGLYTQASQPSRPYLEVSVRTQEAGSRESPAGTVSIPFSEVDRPVTMRVERSCLAGAPYVIAFGWLRSSTDRVVATNERGDTESFHRVTMPGELRAGGSLIYRLLESTATTVLTTTPSGHILSREPYGAGVPQHCSA